MYKSLARAKSLVWNSCISAALYCEGHQKMKALLAWLWELRAHVLYLGGGLRHAHFYLVISLLLCVYSISLLNRLLSLADYLGQCFLRLLSVRSNAKGSSHVDTQRFSAKSKGGASWLARFLFEPGFFASRLNGLAVVFCVRLFVARTLEQPSLMFAVWGCGQALDTDLSFPTGREHVPKLRSVMVTSVSAKDALRHAVRDQLYVGGFREKVEHPRGTRFREKVGAPTGNDTTLRQPNDGGVLV